MSSDKDAIIIAELTQSIIDHHADIEALILRYRNKIEHMESELPIGTATLLGSYWNVVAFCDSLVKELKRPGSHFHEPLY